VLSTCNRTEVYLAHREPKAATARAHAGLAKPRRRKAALTAALFAARDDAATLQLFRVAAGLDSLVPGESQILGQVRAAHEAALTLGTSGPIPNRLFRQALHVGKRVRSETAIADQPDSVPAAAAQLARRVLGELDARRILIIGAGEMSELAAFNLASDGVNPVRRCAARRREGDTGRRSLRGDHVRAMLDFTSPFAESSSFMRPVDAKSPSPHQRLARSSRVQ
jgi:glutamyl-tRNA reductase